MAEADSDTDAGSLLRHVARDLAGERIAPVPPGTVIADRFEIGREIGRGGFGRVFAARDRKLSRDVALKLLARSKRLDGGALELFLREARATARLNHPNIVTAYDFGEWNGTPFLVLELLEGTTLAAELERGRVPERRAWQIVRDITRAVAYAHSRGVLHLDLKAQNVFVLANGTIKVLDFGLAGLDSEERKRIPGGTPATMAPEQRHDGTTDARTDLWAIGVILHQLLVGKLPVAGAAPAGVAGRAKRVLRRTLAVDPADRFPDAAALLAVLEQRPRRSAWLLAALLVGGVAAGWWAMRDPPSDTVAWNHHQLTFRGDVSSAELSPAGDRFVFVTAKQRELWFQDIGSDQPTRVYVGDNLRNPRWFPDGERVLIQTKREHYVVARDRPPRLFAQQHNIAVPMPDGQTVALLEEAVRSGTTPAIQIMSLAGELRTELALPARFAFAMDLDVDAKGRMVVATLDDNLMRVFAVEASQPAKLAWSEEADWVRSVRYSPTGIVYTSGWPNAVLRERARDGDARELIPGFTVGARVSVSRDGQRILYHRKLAWNNLEVVSPSGAHRPLTHGTTRLWGASGSRGRVAYVQETDNQWTLVVADLATGVPRARFRCARWCAMPSPSRDGSRIAFLYETSSGVKVAVIDTDGTNERTLLQTAPARLGALQRLDWVSDREVIYIADQMRTLHLVDVVTGSDQRVLPEVTGGWIHTVRVSPDARHIAIYWNQGDFGGKRRGTFIVERDGAKARHLLEGYRHPIAWAADGRSILVATGEVCCDHFTAIDRIQVTDGAESRVWSADAELGFEHVAAIDDTGDLLLMRRQEASDAWLMQR